MAEVEGLGETERFFEELAAKVRAELFPQIEAAAEDFANVARAVAPVSPLEKNAGDLKAGIRTRPGNKEGQVMIVNDAQDAEGRYYAAHVEFGHKSRNGAHVPAHPSFFPAWRLTRPKIYARLSRTLGRIVRATKANVL